MHCRALWGSSAWYLCWGLVLGPDSSSIFCSFQVHPPEVIWEHGRLGCSADCLHLFLIRSRLLGVGCQHFNARILILSGTCGPLDFLHCFPWFLYSYLVLLCSLQETKAFGFCPQAIFLHHNSLRINCDLLVHLLAGSYWLLSSVYCVQTWSASTMLTRLTFILWPNTRTPSHSPEADSSDVPKSPTTPAPWHHHFQYLFSV